MTIERDTRLGRYIIRAAIGVGGMGAVYRAFDTVLQRQVAIKTILAHKNADGEYLKRFRREALAISQLEDPHIVKLLDFVEGDPEHGEPPYMVMELLRGEDLQSIIAKGPMPIDRAVDILLEVCAAVGACHRHGFIHRDLKGTNVFVTEYNAVETAKVLDFGVAKVWNEEIVAELADASEVTQRGIAVGTPAYLAPEILRGGAATPATDQYALGILLYSALTGGRKPFEVQKKNGEFRELNLMRAILKGDHPSPRTYREDLPEGLEEVIERAIEREAERRHPSVHSMGEALLKWASPRARLQWTGHFTKAPPKPIPARESMAVLPTVLKERGATALDPIRASAPSATSPTTRPVEARELRALLTTAEDPKRNSTTKTWDDRPDAEPAGIPVRRETVSTEVAAIRVGTEPAEASSEGSSDASLAGVAGDAPSNRTAVSRRRPAFLFGSALAGAAAIGAALYLSATPRVPPRAAAPRAAAPAVVSESPVAEAARAPAPPPSPSAPEHSAPQASLQKVEEPEKKSKPRRHRRPLVDENGIGIPSN